MKKITFFALYGHWCKILFIFSLSLDGFRNYFCPTLKQILINVRSGWFVCFLCFFFVFCASLCLLCSRKLSLKEKGSPSKSTGGKEAKTLNKAEDGVKENPSKVTKSLSFTERNKAKHAFRIKDGASRQNSEGQRMLLCAHTQEYWDFHCYTLQDMCCFRILAFTRILYALTYNTNFA